MIDKKSNRGIALVLVLWVTTLMTVVAASFVFTMRTDNLLARNLVQSARAEAFADAGFYRAVYDLIRSPGERQFRGDGVVRHWVYDPGVNLNIQITEETGKINLNTATEELLEGLFSSVGVETEAIDGLIDSIMDWRDADDKHRVNGAEAAEYASAGRKYRPANQLFTIKEELKRVMGMTPDLYDLISDAITVSADHIGVNPAAAPRQVLLALPGATPEIVDDYLLLRESALVANLPPPPFIAAGGEIAPSGGSVYSVRVEALLTTGERFVREAVVRIDPLSLKHVQYLAWSEGEWTMPEFEDNEADFTGIDDE